VAAVLRLVMRSRIEGKRLLAAVAQKSVKSADRPDFVRQVLTNRTKNLPVALRGLRK
jgi:hypothetical protein